MPLRQRPPCRGDWARPSAGIPSRRGFPAELFENRFARRPPLGGIRQSRSWKKPLDSPAAFVCPPRRTSGSRRAGRVSSVSGSLVWRAGPGSVGAEDAAVTGLRAYLLATGWTTEAYDAAVLGHLLPALPPAPRTGQGRYEDHGFLLGGHGRPSPSTDVVERSKDSEVSVGVKPAFSMAEAICSVPTVEGSYSTVQRPSPVLSS